MTMPAVQIGRFASGRDAQTQSGGDFTVGGAGAEDFVAIVPLTEVDGAGEPPVAPTMVESCSPAWPVRRVVGGSGLAVTSGLSTRGRARFNVGWPGVSQADGDAVIAWLVEDVVIGGGGGGLRAIAIRIDGPDADPVELRILDASRVEELMERVFDAEGLYSIGPFECEEVK